jgi:hypothetical protein
MLGLIMLLGVETMAAELPERDVHILFDSAEAAGRVGLARKTRPVDARPARPGEIVVTRLTGEGNETRSKPAEQGDWVVRNRSPTTGNEEYLVKANAFAERYEGPLSLADGGIWQAFRPRGSEMRFFVVSDSDGAFQFSAPWGELMPALPGDAIVRDPKAPKDTYRVAKAAFAGSYEITKLPARE